jgi:hypothetical protein
VGSRKVSELSEITRMGEPTSSTKPQLAQPKIERLELCGRVAHLPAARSNKRMGYFFNEATVALWGTFPGKAIRVLTLIVARQVNGRS